MRQRGLGGLAGYRRVLGSCSWVQACYQTQLNRGKGHHAAVRAVAFKWIRILFACWKQRIAYNPQRYQLSLQTRGSEYAKTTV